MILREDETSIPLEKLAHHFTIDFEAREEMTEKERAESWGCAWIIFAGVVNLFPK